jgi:hypothetical protein
MAYEYENRLKNRLLDLEFDTWEETAQFEREYRELQEVYRKAKAWEEIYKFLSNSPIEPFFKEYLERMANELEDNNND